MSVLLQGIEGFVCLIDDILVIGCDQQEHDSRLHAVLRRLQEANVTLNDKFETSVPELKYIGHLVSVAGIKPDMQKIAAVIDMAPPTNFAEVRYFLGMESACQVLTTSSRIISASYITTTQRQNMVMGGTTRAFQKIKEAICSSPSLVLHDPGKPTLTCADASSFGLGDSLFQKQSDERWRPVTFASRSMTDVERRYAQIEKEDLAITWICERLADYLVGLQFHIHTDHKPLIYLFSADKSLDAIPPRIQRFRLRMMRFSYNISYIPGTTLCTADALSCFPLRDFSSSVPDIDTFVVVTVAAVPLRYAIIDDIRAATTTDSTLQHVLRHCQTG